MTNKTKFNLYYGTNILFGIIITIIILSLWNSAENSFTSNLSFLLYFIFIVMQISTQRLIGVNIFMKGNALAKKLSAEDEKQAYDRMRFETSFSEVIDWLIMIGAIEILANRNYDISIYLVYLILLVINITKWTVQCIYYNLHS